MMSYVHTCYLFTGYPPFNLFLYNFSLYVLMIVYDYLGNF
jgi:hypothetical protein